jgi:HEAT repeat protein
MGRSTLALRALLIIALSSPAFGQDRDASADFRAAKSNIIVQLRGKRENRLAAIAKLEEFPTPEAAKLLLFQGLGSPEEEVRRAAFDALIKFTSNNDVCAFLKTTAGRPWKQGKPQPETYAGVALLLISELPEVNAEAVELIKETAERPETGRILLITLTDELAKCRGEAPCRARTSPFAGPSSKP